MGVEVTSAPATAISGCAGANTGVAVFDIAIVGAGSAGCALAGRLAARTDLRIALIEAGPDYGPQATGTWPLELVDAHHSPDSHDWDFEQSRARVIGGCSAHNECGVVRPLPGDFDRWGIAGWSDADLAPVIDEVASALPAHGKSGLHPRRGTSCAVRR